MTNSRTKGKNGELELANILKDELRLDVRRNWMAQAAEGGADLSIEWPPGYAGWAIECKRARVLRLNDWWRQTALQAQRAGISGIQPKPVLVYRQDRQPWFAMMCLFDLRPDLGDHRQVTLPLESWCKLVRMELDANA